MSALGLLVPLAASALMAVPAAGQTPPVRLDTSDVITYRALTRGDFRGQHPPKAFLGRVDLPRPVAVSCAYVAPDPRARVFAEPIRPGGQGPYRPRVENLAFRGLFSRSCSWWNREHGLSPMYVLEHEQIHFALSEVAARRLNRDVPRMLTSASVESASPDSVITLARRRIQDALERTLAETGKLNLEFDRATSFGFSLHLQEAWRLRVEKDLEELARFAADRPPGRRGPGTPEAPAVPPPRHLPEGAAE
ncbi:MAG: hypothetical protein OXG13_01685 [Gemmatimonadaceae bacterium]|nr:hypothetical protein [Gemmatimonadaceae bacterium]